MPSLDAYLLAEVFDSAGLPDGLMNIVTGAAETGDGIVRHDGVDKISFTGSTRRRCRVARQAAMRRSPGRSFRPGG